MNETIDGKIEEVQREWKEEKKEMEDERNSWQRAILSLFDMFHNATAGKFF